MDPSVSHSAWHEQAELERQRRRDRIDTATPSGWRAVRRTRSSRATGGPRFHDGTGDIASDGKLRHRM